MSARRRPTAAQRRRTRRLRIASWVVLIGIVAWLVWIFLNLSGLAKAGIVAFVVLLAVVWFLWTRRQLIADEMERRAAEADDDGAPRR